jgi:hypothetical protein
MDPLFILQCSTSLSSTLFASGRVCNVTRPKIFQTAMPPEPNIQNQWMRIFRHFCSDFLTCIVPGLVFEPKFHHSNDMYYNSIHNVSMSMIYISMVLEGINKMEDVIIRPAVPEDLKACHAIYCYYMKHCDVTPIKEKPPFKMFHEKFCAVKDAGLNYDVLEDNDTGEIIGFSYTAPANRFLVPTTYPNVVEGSIYFRPGYTGGGLAKSLNEYHVN